MQSQLVEENLYWQRYYLLKNKDIRAAKNLLPVGVNVNYRKRSNFIDVHLETLLLKFARSNNKQAVEFLLDNGANPLIKNALGYLPIQQVRWNEKDGKAIGRMLLDKMCQ